MKLLAVIGRVSLAISLIALINPTLLHHPAQAAPQPQGQAIAQIASPAEGQTLTGLVAVSGSADHPEFARWELAYGPDPNPNDAWQPFASGDQPILNGTIGTHGHQEGVIKIFGLLNKGRLFSNLDCASEAPSP